MTVDRWGDELCGDPSSLAAWDTAWERFMAFRGDPFAALAAANADDGSFVLGSVFEALYLVLAGSRLDAPGVCSASERARGRAVTERDRAHVTALDHLVVGDFTAAGDHWADLARRTGDFAAIRFAHDVFLHVGDNERRLAAGAEGYELRRGGVGFGLVAGQYSFALNEVGRYTEAEEIGRFALDTDPNDVWARHALAHVYEETDDTPAALALLEDTVDVWHDQDLLANHVWWHLAIRLVAAGRIDAALAVHDRRMPEATTAFRLCDQTSLLWRAELAGADVGDRWAPLADRWDTIAERHTCGFLDLHAVLAYQRSPDHPGAARWRDGLALRSAGGDREIDRVFAEVVAPLAEAFDARGRGDLAAGSAIIDRLGASMARIGGSNAQRAIVPLSFSTSTTPTEGRP